MKYIKHTYVDVSSSSNLKKIEEEEITREDALSYISEIDLREMETHVLIDPVVRELKQVSSEVAVGVCK